MRKINLGVSSYWIGRQIVLDIGYDSFDIFLDFDRDSFPRSISWIFEIDISISLDGKISNRSDIEIPVHLWKTEVGLQAEGELDQFIQSSISRKLQIIKDHLLTGLDKFWEKNFG